MVPFAAPPTEEEMAYARSMMRGRRKVDLAICLAFALVGVAVGVQVALYDDPSGSSTADPGSIPAYALGFGAALFVIGLVEVYSVRSIQSMGRKWRPLRYVWYVVIAWFALSLVRPLAIDAGLRGETIAGALALPILNIMLGIPLACALMYGAFLLRSGMGGEDGDEVLAAAVDEDASARGSEDASAQLPGGTSGQTSDTTNDQAFDDVVCRPAPVSTSAGRRRRETGGQQLGTSAQQHEATPSTPQKANEHAGS